MTIQTLLFIFAQAQEKDPFDHTLGLILGSVFGFGLGVLGTILLFRKFLRPGAPSQKAPCPQCGTTLSTPVSFTWWGGLLGPRLIHLVECTHCKTRFNGKSGSRATVWITLYLLMGILLGILIIWLVLANTVFA